MPGFTYPLGSRQSISTLLNLTDPLAPCVRAQHRVIELLWLDTRSHNTQHEFPRPLRAQFVNILRLSFAYRHLSLVSFTPLDNELTLLGYCTVQYGIQVGFKSSRRGGSLCLQTEM